MPAEGGSAGKGRRHPRTTMVPTGNGEANGGRWNQWRGVVPAEDRGAGG